MESTNSVNHFTKLMNTVKKKVKFAKIEENMLIFM